MCRETTPTDPSTGSPSSGGAKVEIRLDDGTIRSYSILERTMYDKEQLSADRIWRSRCDEEFVLITCGGDFDRTNRHYRQTIVVYAVPMV